MIEHSSKVYGNQINLLESVPMCKEQLEKKICECQQKIKLFDTMVKTLLMYDFETNKNKDLIFVHVPSDMDETEKSLKSKVKSLIQDETHLHHDIKIQTVNKIENNQKIVIQFEKLVDKENILERSETLNKCHVEIGEHLPKYQQNIRRELRKIQRVFKKGNPNTESYVQYDKLYIAGKTFVYDGPTGCVQEEKNTLGLER